MNILRLSVILIATLLFVSESLSDEMIGPFGLGIEKSTINEVNSLLKSKNISSQDIGQNLYSLGHMLKTNSDFGIDGFNEQVFIFDSKDRLAAVVIKFNKNYFDSIYNSLAKKYTLSQKNIPFVGNKSAEFIKDNVSIIIEAPHLSFAGNLTYASKDFLNSFNEVKAAEENAKTQQQDSSL